MADQIEDQINRILDRNGRTNCLDNLMQGYRLCARSEGKSDNTISNVITAVAGLRNFLESSGLSTDADDIGAREMREYTN